MGTCCVMGLFLVLHKMFLWFGAVRYGAAKLARFSYTPKNNSLLLAIINSCKRVHNA